MSTVAPMNIANASAQDSSNNNGNEMRQTAVTNLQVTVIDKLWGGTSHKYLFLGKNSSLVEKIIGYLILGLQFLIFAIICYYASQSEDGGPKTLIMNGRNCVFDDDGDNGYLDASLAYCYNVEQVTVAAMIPTFFIIFVFLAPDIILAAKSFKYSIIASLMIIIESLLAIVTTMMVVVASVNENEGYNAMIFSAVAIVFVHDMDEQVYKATSNVTKRGQITYLVAMLLILGLSVVTFIGDSRSIL